MTRVIIAGGGTGGHLYPGLAIARALVRERPSIQPFFVGARRGLEARVLPESEFPHILLDLHPLYRTAVWNNVKTLIGAMSGWRAISRLVEQDPPAMIVGTGGYAAAIMQAYGAVHHIPMVQQAGDSVPGLTARLFSRWCREIYLNFPEAARILKARDHSVFVDTGAPIDPPPVPRPDKLQARAAWKLPPNDHHVLLISGASQGSLAINTAISKWIERGLPNGLAIIWSTGRGTYEQFKQYENPHVRVREYLAPIADAYAAADFALSRAGAMTTAEQFAWGIPAILVPLPTAAADHQTANAVALERAGAAIHIPQSSLTVDLVDATVRRLLSDTDELERLKRGAESRARPAAASTIAHRILALMDRPDSKDSPGSKQSR